jgi:hypothetical protein
MTLVAEAERPDAVAENVLNGEENMVAVGLLLGQPFSRMRRHGENNDERDYPATG